MKKYLIERQIPGVGHCSPAQLKTTAAASNAALARLSPKVQWLESFLTGDKTLCVYLADDEAVIREHASLAGIPADRITEIKSVIDPTTATR